MTFTKKQKLGFVVCVLAFSALVAAVVLMRYPLYQTIVIENTRAVIFAESDEDALKRRSAERWQALLARNFHKVASFATPSYQQVYGVRGIGRTYGGSLMRKSVEFVSMELAEDRKSAKVKYVLNYYTPEFSGNGMMELQSFPSERWELISGVWWRVEERK